MKYEKGLVSVVIPCYNYGKYIHEALNSVLAQGYKNYEIIVVNDGSTDKDTIKTLRNLKVPRTQVIHTKNQGLAMARNTGIQASKGEFFIPLDSDDKLAPNYIESVMKAARKDSKIGVVYTNIWIFGDLNYKYKLKEFDIIDEMVGNYVSVCSLVRRKAYDQVKRKNSLGYNPNMKFGYEDWDFWLSIHELKWKFKYLNKDIFFYRKSGLSMIDRAQKKHDYLIEQLIENHAELFDRHAIKIIKRLQSHYKLQSLELVMLRGFLEGLKSNLLSSVWLSKRILLWPLIKLKIRKDKLL